MFLQEYAALTKVGQNFAESVDNKLFTVLLNQQQKSTNNISSRSDIGWVSPQIWPFDIHFCS